METTIMRYIGATRRVHSFIPSQPNARSLLHEVGVGLRFLMDS